ncbi:MAG: hypothetical protein LRY69_01255 [Gammaproteobacteria bacterium]|nr:hypothetical protein [Gammaproteobacteria bacterium]
MAIAQTKEENTLVMGTETDGIYDRPMILTYSKNGDLLATQKFSLSLYAYYTYWLTLNDNGTYITLLKGDPVSIIKWNKNGQPLWLAVSSNDQLHVASSAPYGIALLPDGRFIVALTVSRTISGDAVLLAQYG